MEYIDGKEVEVCVSSSAVIKMEDRSFRFEEVGVIQGYWNCTSDESS